MKNLARGLCIAALVAYPCTRLIAHVRLIHPGNGAALRWSSPGNVSIVSGAAGSDDIPDGSTETSLRLAIREWNSVSGTTAQLVEDTSPASQARTDFESTGIHLILFDETNASGYFGPGSATVALTPIWFNASGTIVDADILFNGSGFTFTTRGVPGRFDVQDVATHELGHLLGLDHSGVASATMYPYVDQGLILQRSLSQDELAGLRDAYPSGSHGQITGSIERLSDGSGVAGAYLVARDAGGRPQASILANANGDFTLRGLAPGTYDVYARPFDVPVGEINLGAWYSGKIDTDFEPEVYVQTATITGGNTIALGDLAVGGDVSLSLGTVFDSFPLRVVAGQVQLVQVNGVGLVTGSTLVASDPDLILGVPDWRGSMVMVSITVPSGESPGHVDLAVTNPSGELSILPFALEITPPSPSVSSVVPGTGAVGGGDALTITGTGFLAGARVVIGDRIYTDGVDATVADANTILLTTAATLSGEHDVVVIDGTGVEGRAVDGFRVLSAPTLSKVLPAAGDFGGGTPVVLAGQGFVDGMQVRIDGVDQGPVTVDPGAQLARFTSQGGVIGGPYVLEMENPDGAIASLAFAYVNQPDPTIASVSPASGSANGGSLVTLTGANFTPTMDVSILADPAGSPVDATGVTFVDASTLQFTTPQHASGLVSLILSETNGAGAFSEGSFTFTGGGGGGGGCYMVPADGLGGPRAWLEGAWWILAVLALTGLRGLRVRKGVFA